MNHKEKPPIKISLVIKCSSMILIPTLWFIFFLFISSMLGTCLMGTAFLIVGALGGLILTAFCLPFLAKILERELDITL